MKDPGVFVRHILEAIERIEEFIEGKTKSDFLEDIQLQDATIRRIEIIGEASKNIPEDFKRNYPEIAWSEMSRTRDKLIHGYFGVDLDLTWNIVKTDLPELKDQIESIIGELGES
jgi:uncharacterized protein with HEPN domain